MVTLMAIRFHCKSCQQLLGISSRKAGSQIDCPTCGAAQTVPSEDTANAAITMSESARAWEAAELASAVVIYDEEPANRQPAVPSESPGPTQPPSSRIAPERPIPEGMILYPRRTLYVNGILFLVVGVVGFAAGYLMGRGDASEDLVRAREEASKQRVPVEGRLVYDSGTGKIAADAGAVVMVLPAGEFPEKRISTQGLRPQDPPPDDSQKSVRTITALGGVYGRADDTGAFSFVVPEQGNYRLLLISRHARRAPQSVIEEVDLDEMQKYFRGAARLVGRWKYRWSAEQFHTPTEIQYNFGADSRAASN